MIPPLSFSFLSLGRFLAERRPLPLPAKHGAPPPFSPLFFFLESDLSPFPQEQVVELWFPVLFFFSSSRIGVDIGFLSPFLFL